MNGFRGAVQASGSVMGGSYSGRSGSAPTPFDNVDGYRLVGPQGSHPLAALSIDELLRGRSDGLQGTIEIKHPVRIGEAIEGGGQMIGELVPLPLRAQQPFQLRGGRPIGGVDVHRLAQRPDGAAAAETVKDSGSR